MPSITLVRPSLAQAGQQTAHSPLILALLQVRIEEMWLYEDLVWRQPGGDKLPTKELRENNVSVHLLLPGTQERWSASIPATTVV